MASSLEDRLFRAGRLLEYYGRKVSRRISYWPRLPKVAKDLTVPQVRPLPGASGVGIVAICKNEGPNIREWVEFHKLVGFDRFYIYDNGSTDRTTAELADLATTTQLVIVPWRSFDTGRDPQFLAYNHALAQFGGLNEWIAFIDIDEFLFPIADQPIGEVLARYADTPAISVPWVMYGSSGHEKRPPGRVTENFVLRAPFPPPKHKNTLLNYKSIVRPAFVEAMTKHFPRLIGEPAYFYTEHKVRLHKAEYINPRYATSDIFRLNHYYSKSRAEIVEKVAQGPISRRNRAWRKYDRFLVLEDATEHDNLIVKKWEAIRPPRPAEASL